MEQIKRNLKLTAQAALENEYGFKPALKDIVLLEGSDDRTYILFRVKNHEYRFTSHIFNINVGDVWVGDGTIEKIN